MNAQETKTPGPRGREALSVVLRMGSDPIGALGELVDTYGDVVRFNLAGETTFLMRSPEAAAHVLVARQENYSRVRYPVVDEMFGEGLFTSLGEKWARKRRMAQPVFAARRLGGFEEHFARAVADTVDALGGTATKVDVSELMRELSLDAVCRALFGADLDDHAKEIKNVMTVFGATAGKVLTSPLVQVLSQTPGVGPERAWRMQVRRRRTVIAAARGMDRAVGAIVERRKGAEEKDDLLGRLLAARDEDSGRPLSPREIRDEATGYILAAQDTTGLTLTWMWYHLARNPAARDAMENEISKVLGDRTPTAADAENLPWTKAVISETLRLSPPVWMLDRKVVEDDEVLGHHVPAGSRVMILPYLCHRDTRWWPDPETFDPDRFLPGNDAGRPKTAYLPYGGGRRICIGAGFAMLEATIAAATLARRFRFDLPPGVSEVAANPTTTFGPKDGLPMVVSRR